MKEICINSNSYSIDSRTIEFLVEVEKAIILSNKIIVELDVQQLKAQHPEIEYWRAIFAYDFDGNILWQVENPWYIDRETGERIEYDNNKKKRFPGGDCVGTIWYEKEGDYIVAAGRVGYRLDTNNGKLLEIVWRER